MSPKKTKTLHNLLPPRFRQKKPSFSINKFHAFNKFSKPPPAAAKPNDTNDNKKFSKPPPRILKNKVNIAPNLTDEHHQGNKNEEEEEEDKESVQYLRESLERFYACESKPHISVPNSEEDRSTQVELRRHVVNPDDILGLRELASKAKSDKLQIEMFSEHMLYEMTHFMERNLVRAKHAFNAEWMAPNCQMYVGRQYRFSNFRTSWNAHLWLKKLDHVRNVG